MAVKRTGRCDQALLIVTLLLLAMGLLMVFSASFVAAAESRGDPYFFLRRQALWALVGLAAMFCFSALNYQILKKLCLLIMALNLLFLGLLYSELGTDLGTSAVRWLSLGPLILQPVEFSKPALVIFVSAYMSANRLNLRHFWMGTFVPLLISGFVFFLIQRQPDLGSAIVVFAGAAMVIFIAGIPLYQVAGLSLLSVFPLVYLLYQEEYRMQRIFSFIDPWADPSGSGYQIIQSFLALGPGRLFGAGLGRGTQKLFYLPEPQNDFIFAVIGEELGFIGAVTVLLLYLVFIWRGVQIAQRAPDLFGSLLASGLVFVTGVQVLVNVGVVTGSLPVTGINLPLISYGGSSVFFTLISIGILLNISRYRREDEDEEGKDNEGQ